MNIPVDWAIAGPATIVAAGAVIALLVDAFFPRRTWLGSGLPSTAALIAAGLEMFRLDHDIPPATFALSLILLVGTLFVVVASNVMNFENSMPPGEYHFLMLSSAAGALLMVSARDVVTLLVALELLSLPSIALVGLRQGDRRAIRSAWTFFLASVVSTAITLMGISLLYGIAGTLDYEGIGEALRESDMPDSVVAVAILLTVIGLLFKLGAVPFHMWIPDAYLGAPILVAGFLSSVSKAASLGALLTFLAIALGYSYDTWGTLLAVVAAVTMTIGNLGALRRTNAIGMLAWSSVAQAGFLLAPAAVGVGTDAAIQYLAVYVLTNLVAFAALAVVLRLRGSTDYDELRGLARTDPPTGIPLALAALTLAGFPPAIIGLVAKYVVIQPVIEAGETWLAVVMAINVMLGLAYYLRFVAVLFDKPEGETYVSPSPPFSVRVAKSVVILGALGIVALSVWPDLLLSNLP
ncbi:NADH-quinone oxidoreductase subunit N [Aeromicrobium panaciterrae]|uniref:NADH-quinone oxidoreductase subunit N n=1 Tax=Aeromicrobium panaciterrae TaxID=363861 RepID=A0ABU1URS1_9ACTN|nr:NADH-quinone oxidoreductase subunit N [Aeromicrobium panaciterrae]MDR7087838.1 NADH-quinone oxidoreductase subunit N [Aeromicrobium panaciterrae]